jgi:CRP-like cAMP-binding protein
VLEEEPDLGEHLDAVAFEEVREAAVAEVLTLPTGKWPEPRDAVHPRGHLGLLILEGLLSRDASLAGTTGTEILGTGDLIRPWDDDEFATAPVTSTWTVLEPARLAVLDERFAERTAGWPAFTAAIMSRYVRRSRWLVLQLAVGHQRRVDARLLLLFWNMADRFGRVRPEGVFLPAPMRHELLGRLVGARRPSVTSALGELAQAGLVERRAGGWLLSGEDPRGGTVEQLESVLRISVG